MDVARAIGLSVKVGEVTGTIDEERVLAALADLAEGDSENDDLFREAEARVRAARSAGLEEHGAESLFGRPSELTFTQLRYRSEMAEIFLDLAIDVGLRHHEKLAAAA